MSGFDLAITNNGEFDFDIISKQLKIVYNDSYRVQMAMCRIQSIKSDWFIDHIGADLEEVIGMPNTNDTLSLCSNKIISAITFDLLYTAQEIYINYIYKDLTSYVIKVFLRTLDAISSNVLIVNIDLVKGVNIVIGED